ncbi:MAG: hypothetical protein ACT443_16180 [Gemmatimonadota bacterium]
MLVQTGDSTMPRANTRRRNIYLALALVLFATSGMFIFGLDGFLVWALWRDAPAVAALLAAGAIYCAVRWWRTPRS